MNYTYNPLTNSFTVVQAEANNQESFSLPHLVWVITDKCFNHCPFCFQPKTSTEINTDSIKETISLFKMLRVKKIDISGGEPLFYNDLILIIESLLENGINVTISTTGTGLPKNQQWVVDNASLLSRVIISLNGANSDQVDSIYGNKGAYQSFASFVNHLQDHGCSNLRINTVVTRLLLDENTFQSMIVTVNKIKPLEWCLIEPHPDNKLPTFDDYAVSSEIFDSFTQKARLAVNDSHISVILRSIKNYTGYWILNPDGNIMLHSDGSHLPFSYRFDSTTLPLIVAKSQEVGLWIPV